MKLEFSRHIFFLGGGGAKPKYQVSQKPVHWEGTYSMRTDRRTDMAKLIVAFRDFQNAPKTVTHTSKTEEHKLQVNWP